jgi:hypothetical protein
VGLLDDLKDWGKRPEAWRDLTRCGRLFQELREAVRARTVAGLIPAVEECKAFVVDVKTRHAWETVRTLVWCAEEAANFPDFYRNEIDRNFFAISRTPAFIKSAEPFAWTCIRTFLDAPSRAVEVHAAVWDEPQGEDEGFMATLVLEAMDGGPTDLVHHPADVFCTMTDDQFRVSMQNAWIAAGKLVSKQRPDLRCHGRWRLLRDGQPLAEVRGGSAGGAAGWGWWYALQGKVPDPEVIVIAQVDAAGILTGVDPPGIRPKVRAIARDGRFDTIVVASGQNQSDAVTALLDLPPQVKINVGIIKVVDLNSGISKLVDPHARSVTEKRLDASDA